MITELEAELDYVKEIIIAHPFFKGVRLCYLPFLTESASLLRVGMREPIFREGQSASHLYLLQTGQVALETFIPREGTTTVQTLEAGEALGLSWMFPPYVWQFSARTLEPCELVALNAESLRKRAHENPEFGYDLLMRMSRVMWHRLQSTRKRLVEMYEA
jgi:CRP/FNR family transcriptional regulator, cyclic AMP receptor protein